MAGIVKGSAEALGMQSVVNDLGDNVLIEVRADSSAAIGICNRSGIGKIRHLAVGQLWVQERIREKELTLSKWPGADNPADVLSKHVPAELLRKHVPGVGLDWELGRSTLAPGIGVLVEWQPAKGVEPRPARRSRRLPSLL